MKILILLAFCGLSLAATIRTEVPRAPHATTHRTLQDDLNDFLALIPVADIEALFLDYLANDAEMQNAMIYLQSDECEELVFFIDSEPVVQDLLKYLVAAGLDVVTWLNSIHDFLGIPHIVITKRASGRSLAEFGEKVKALIPIDALKALYADKLVSSPDFKALIDKITSRECRDKVYLVEGLPEIMALTMNLYDLGIDVEAIAQFVRDLFGWPQKMSKAARTLQDDLNDFLALIPVSDIEALFLDYLANDAEMQNAMTYLQSDEFEGIVLFVDSQPEVQDLFKYLIAAGLDVVSWLNGIHDFLGIPHIVITKRASGRSLAEFWEKVKALIPIDALKALYADKLVSSPDFKALIDKITSDEFHNMVLTVKALPEVQALRQRLLDLGIDVEAIEQFVRDLFGWNKKMSKAARTLQDDLNDFLALIPVADIEALFLDYLANDAEMQNAMTYLQSDEFEGIVLFVDSQPEVQDLFKYLIAAGLDVVTWLNGIHDFLGIPHIVITKRASGRSLAEFWEKVKALIPIDALKALYADKLVSSPDFKALVDKITSDEFHNMVLTVKALPEVQALRQRLLDLGIDVEAIEQFVRDLFGW